MKKNNNEIIKIERQIVKKINTREIEDIYSYVKFFSLGETFQYDINKYEMMPKVIIGFLKFIQLNM